MKRGPLKEAFHGEGPGAWDALEAQATSGKEELIVDVHGTLSFLTETNESDADAIKKLRFVRGELQMENGQVFTFWLSTEGRESGANGDMGVYDADQPQTG